MDLRWGYLAIALFTTLSMIGCLPSDEVVSGSSEAFCSALLDVRTHPPKEAAEYNELKGHTANLVKLRDSAPDVIRDDLSALIETFSATRDSKETDTLKAFWALSAPQLAGYEGRVAKYAETHCDIKDGTTDYKVDDRIIPKGVCPAWPRVGSPLTNNRFPYLLDTAAANYFSSVFLTTPFGTKREDTITVPRGGRIEMKGEYPYTRYFGFHPNDMATNNFQTLMDVDIEPDAGSANPWRGPMPKGAERRFTVQMIIDKQPPETEPNTVYIGEKKDGGMNMATFLIYRMYGSDMGALPPNSSGVKLPSVTIFDKNDEQMVHYPECDPYPEGYDPPVDNTVFPAFPVPDHRAQSRPGKVEIKGNFGLDVDILSNGDVTYLTSYFGREYGEVFTVRAKKPKTVNAENSVMPWSDTRDFRMWTACTYNFWNGAANDCIQDNDVIVDEEGYYTLVISESGLRPDNATRENGITWLDAGAFIDGQLTYRMLPTRSPFLQDLTRQIKDGETSPYIPKTAFCDKEIFEAGGFETCFLKRSGK